MAKVTEEQRAHREALRKQWKEEAFKQGRVSSDDRVSKPENDVIGNGCKHRSSNGALGNFNHKKF